MQKVKTCSKCGIEKPASDFRLRGDRSNCLRYKCIECERAYNREYGKRRNSDERRAYARAYYHKKKAENPQWALRRKQGKLLRQYGLTFKQYEAMLTACGGRCQICGGEPNGHGQLHVDHCHETGKVRGLLCGSCNMGLGNLGDNAASLRRALEYLESQ